MKTIMDSRNRPVQVEDSYPNSVREVEALVGVSKDSKIGEVYGDTNWGRECTFVYDVPNPAEAAEILRKVYRYCDSKFMVIEHEGKTRLGHYNYYSMGD